MQYTLELERLASAVGNGQHSGLKCPACGAHTNDRALSLYVNGKDIRAVCHRASCGFRFGTNYGVPGVVNNVRSSRARPYTGELRLLDTADIEWLMWAFHLTEASASAIRKSDGRYFLPIVGPEGSRRGWVSRRPWLTSPISDNGIVFDESKAYPKSLTYMDNDEPVMSWYGQPPRWPVVAVEDQISALRVVQDTGLRSVALLGTGINEEKVAELQRHTRHLVIALDADATGQAFSHARKWGQAFESCRVAILQKDIKDESPAAVREIFSQIAAI